MLFRLVIRYPDGTEREECQNAYDSYALVSRLNAAAWFQGCTIEAMEVVGER